MLFRYFTCLLMLPPAVLISVGCSESPTVATSDDSQSIAQPDAHENPIKSLEQAIAKVTSLRNTIRDSFANDDPDTAHGPLHEVGDVLLLISDLAKKQNVSAESQSAIETEVNTLLDAFGSVDKTLHGQEGSTYDEESAAIDTALTALAKACNVTPAETE